MVDSDRRIRLYSELVICCEAYFFIGMPEHHYTNTKTNFLKKLRAALYNSMFLRYNDIKCCGILQEPGGHRFFPVRKCPLSP